ncbi:uroporphyrinogen-III C-methyltransferase [Metabacillus fastidiosus]|uniref:uroporphyrinogen-III C-methyltransferase n=1 Tax=Metabacillus fastidiosus TaxID=1458 RepID=A0ABU6NWY6_9BACI|nr:uroporphyrinogen-III C-methyltransferase [Metabacillus fastidiosus]MED4401631.1 uroporphyrinogen-III C-methyltransferase [Metabacillus fastidiosus]MED4452809.1 uroporphyrinogen-III C-methyltransferase [Metabacillus fastidiosus]MED4463270.1 uroporphyrinogen-III C-methyltransferase [Metabacillus fastidiosus]
MAKVYLVGAGPGDEELLTIKALKCIKEADVILYDRLVNKEILKHAKEDADLIYCGKLPNYHTMKQETINHFLVKYAKSGKIVTRLKGGDPFVFGRGGEEAEALAMNNIPFEIVPGVTSGVAAAAYAGIPVTHRDLSASVAFITGHRKDDADEEIRWEALAKGIDTLAIYMGVGNLPYIQAQLLKHGKSEQTPVAVIHWGTTNIQRTVTGTLENIYDVVKQQNITNPSMIIIGDVVNLKDKLSWYEERLLQTAASEAF